MASIYRRGKVYWIQWSLDGERHNESLRTTVKKEALIAKSAKELETRTGVSVAQSNCTVAEFSVQYLLWHRGEYPWAEKGMRYYFDSTLLPSFGHMRLASLDPQQVELWKHKRNGSMGHLSKRPRTRLTVNSELKKLKALVNKAVEWGVIPRNTIAPVKMFQNLDANARGYLTKEQLNALYTADPETAAIWQLMANTGMRIGEAMNLKWTRVNAERVRVVSSQEHMTKTRQWRDIPVSPGCRSALAELRGRNDGYVLPRVNITTLRRYFKKACDKAGFDAVPHELRHTFISHLVMQGIPLRTVQVLAGHKSIAVTEQYAHLAPNHMSDMVSSLHL